MAELSDEWQTPLDLFNELNQEFNFDVDLCATKENSKCLYYFDDYLKDDVPNNKSGGYVLCDEFDWRKHRRCAFMNPPYSNPRPFIEKAWEDSKYCKIVCLIKCDPSTRWWATFWNYSGLYLKCPQCRLVQYGRRHNGYKYCNNCSLCPNSKLTLYNGPKPGCEYPRYFPKRIQFDPPQQLIDSGEAKKDAKGKWMVYDEIIGWYSLSGPTFPCALLIFDRRGL